METKIALVNYKNYVSHRLFMRSLIPKRIKSDIEIQKEFLKKQGVKLSTLWHSEAYKTIRYVNFLMAGYKK
jgi:glycerol-3-phosphate O-acyltransferase